MRLFARLFRLIWGAEVDAPLRPLFVFVAGEMLWVPTSQAIVAGLAPEDVRGAYMGAFWFFFASVSLIAAATGLAAVRGASRRRVAPVAAGY